MLKAPDVPSVLIELGFLSNERDAERLRSEDHRRALAEAIVSALDEYFLGPLLSVRTRETQRVFRASTRL